MFNCLKKFTKTFLYSISLFTVNIDKANFLVTTVTKFSKYRNHGTFVIVSKTYCVYLHFNKS